VRLLPQGGLGRHYSYYRTAKKQMFQQGLECNKERNEQAYGKSTTEDVLFSKSKPKIDSATTDPGVWRESMVDTV